jgi:hypothetical protein
MPDNEHIYTIRDRGKAARFVKRRHADFAAIEMVCSWILDTLEGGEQYKRATYRAAWQYGTVQNMIRHRREWPIADDGTPDAYAAEFWGTGAALNPAARQLAEYNRAAEQNFQIRLQRTPTPTKLRQIIDKHLSHIYKNPPRRETKGASRMAVVEAWWEDVDGRGTDINKWMRESVAPLLIALGMLDIYCDHPAYQPGDLIPDPTGDAADVAADPAPLIVSEADVIANNLHRCHAQFILPQNVLWYRLDYTGRHYIEVLIREYAVKPGAKGEPDKLVAVFRYWTKYGWTLYDGDGRVLGEGVHSFGRVPIERVFDRRHPRLEHAGDARFFGVVEKSREYFNEESELIYAMDLQCFAFLEAPPIEFNEAGDAIPIGPGMVLYRVPPPGQQGPSEGYGYVAPPTAPLEFLMQRLESLDAAMDAEAGLSRPASARAVGGKTYPASGIAKAFDQEEGNQIMAGVAMSLQECEEVAAGLAAGVVLDQVPTDAELAALKIVYTTEFNLLRYDEMSIMSEAYIAFRDQAGKVPPVEKRVLRWMADYMIRGIDDTERQAIGKAIDDYVDRVYNAPSVDAVAAPVPVASNGKPAVPLPIAVGQGGGADATMSSEQ